MPPKALPKAYHILVKTHKMTIFLTVPQSSTVAFLKEETLSALSSHADDAGEVPTVTTESSFELCRVIKDKTRSTISYEVVDESQPVKGLLNNWEVLFVQFRDETGALVPVEVSQASLLDDEEDESISLSPMSKGKRKAHPE